MTLRLDQIRTDAEGGESETLGNATLAAARRFARVTSTDYVPSLLEKGAARAAAEGLQVAFQVADAEGLPFGDASFDVFLSNFGAMFTPDHTRPAPRNAPGAARARPHRLRTGRPRVFTAGWPIYARLRSNRSSRFPYPARSSPHRRTIYHIRPGSV